MGMPFNRGLEETQRATKYFIFSAKVLAFDDFPSKHLEFLEFCTAHLQGL